MEPYAGGIWGRMGLEARDQSDNNLKGRSSDSQRAKPSDELAKGFIPALGLAFLLAWIYALFSTPTAPADLPDNMLLAQKMPYVACSIALTGSYLLAARFHTQLEPLLAHARLRMIDTAALCAITLVITWLPAESLGSYAIPLQALCSGIAGVLSAAMFLMYGEWFSRLGGKTTCISAIVSFGLSSMLAVYCSLIPGVASMMTRAILPLLAGVCLSRSGSIKIYPYARQQTTNALGNPWVLGSLYILITIWGFVNRFLSNVYTASTSAGMSIPDMTAFRDIGIAILVSFAVLLAGIIVLFPRLTKMPFLLRCGLALILAACLLCPMALAFESPVGAIGLMTGPTSLFVMAVWIIGSLLGALFKGRGSFFFPLLLAAWTFGGVVAEIAFTTASVNKLAGAFDAFAIASIVLLFLVFMSCLSIFNISNLFHILPNGSDEASNGNAAPRSQELARAYDLSNRELEILALLAKGLDASYIEKTLFISYNTVATHRKHIYRKLGVHSQQELIEFMMEEERKRA